MELISSISFAILGALIGSFVGVIAERAYTGQSWKKGRSRCNSCNENLKGRDLVPVFSWLVHRGRCRMCHARIAGAYALYELSMALIFFFAYQAYGVTLSLFVFLVAIAVLAFITIYDLRHTIVPPGAVTVFIILSGLFAMISSGSILIFIHTLLQAAVIAFVFFLLYLLSRGRAMGFGDTPAVFGLSLLVGQAAVAGVLFSFWVGGVIGIFILVFRKGGPKMGIEVPFVPFMVVGFLLALFTQWNPLTF